MWSNKLDNPNSSWANLRGTWISNVLIVVVLKVAFSILPGVTPEISWTLTNLTYNIVIVKVRKDRKKLIILVFVLIFVIVIVIVIAFGIVPSLSPNFHFFAPPLSHHFSCT